MEGWISVQDAMPELEGRYIVASPTHRHSFIAHYTNNLKAISNHLAENPKPGWWNSDDEAVWAYRDITHWQKMPEPPYK